MPQEQKPFDLRTHLRDGVLGWWQEHGPDEQHGGIFTCWNNAGTELVSTDKYTWSQGRWAWLTARVATHAELVGVDAQRYSDYSVRTSEFVADHALAEDFTTAYVTTAAGEPFEPEPGSGLHTSIFADMFAALGFAGTATVDPGGGWAELSLSMLQRAAAAIDSGDVPSAPYPVPAGHRSLGLPMILIGVGEQVYRATGSDTAKRIVAGAGRDITEHFLQLGDSDVAEMPTLDGTSGSLLARHRTPGHILELMWFCHHARDLLTGPLAEAAVLAAISARALNMGWDRAHGGLLRFTDSAGGLPRGDLQHHPYEDLVRATWDTKLWWPHAEAMYTVELISDAANDAALRAWIEPLTTYTLATFPDPGGNEWVQIRDRTGAPHNETVALPVKDPFHIARSLLLLLEHRKDAHAPDHADHSRSS